MARSGRKDRYDIPDTVMLNADLHVRGKERAEELDLSFSGYVRKLIIDDLTKSSEKRLSQSRRTSDSVEVTQLLHNLNRLLTKNGK
jgi:hypothetical protein